MSKLPSISNHMPNLPLGTAGAGRSKSGTPWWLWALAAGLLALIVVQQRPEPPNPQSQSDAAKGLGPIEPPAGDPMVLIGKLMLGFDKLAPTYGSPGATTSPFAQLFQQQADLLAGWQGTNPAQPASVANPPTPRSQPAPADTRIRAALLASLVQTPEEVDWRLSDVADNLDPASPLVGDVASIRAVLASQRTPTAVSSPPLDPASIQGLIDRHGWFAKIVLAGGDPASPVRLAAQRDGQLLVALLSGVGALIVLAVIAGLVMQLIAIVNRRSLRARLIKPDPKSEWPAGEEPPAITGNTLGAGPAVGPGIVAHAAEHRTPSSIWLETVCVFFASFLALKGAALGVEHLVGKHAAGWTALLGQWLTALAIGWPLFRGMTVRRWREELGLTRGQGVLREIFAGVGAYLAAVPLYLFLAIVVVLIMLFASLLSGAETPVPEGNKLIDMIGGGSPLQLALLFMLATIWAPLVEECVFRGALYRHLRRRAPVVVAGLASALVFAVMHGYAVQGLVMVGGLGFAFALMREWRGSLIAPITAHFIHNFVVLSILIAVMSLASA
jgi:membrane protease YdiL (CAAX protease family)